MTALKKHRSRWADDPPPALSKRFLQEREWTCPKHDEPQIHRCDCRDCFKEFDCTGCESAEWVGVVDMHGEPVMRELTWAQAMHVDSHGTEPPDLVRKVEWDGE